ncbi:DUF6519 domain-containing protein [Pseudorhodoferax sp. Leaf267]|uniref:DUF6519 domain-containing protein n=1 Tax=Pseudorhodoferax sp. Leaf267 TaxID=1736316 RepID=UPI0006F4FC81|nr:DUF6519 domain-containing protein [Pseudorhodoferax sp. Leaf267]KQP12266.1 hypothetical protein ASF43_22440 [Pseudorhodoferax sp. Leaf267]
MKGDLSRETFDPAARYSAVRMQQGRVITDADFNEQGDITRHKAERLAEDTIGPCGAPAEHPGYALTAGTRALAVQAFDATNAWVAGEDGVLLRTANNGTAWTLAPTGSTRHLRALGRVGNVGWAVGDGGTVLRTNNGGAGWTAQSTGHLAHLRGVHVLDANRAWAVGDGGLVLATTDAGATWAAHTSGVARLHGVVFADALRGLAVGPGGAIVQSADGGQSWTAVDSGSTAHLRSVALLGSSAWAVGDTGTALRSTDGGATWATVATGTGATLRAVRFRDANEGWAVGDGGTVLHSADGGASWAVFSTGTGQDLANLSVTGTEPAWAVGGEGPVWRLTNAAPTAAQSVALPSTSLLVQPGRYYVQGQLCELDAPASLANQPDGGVPERLPAGTHLVYLRAWQRHISALEAPAIREQALGGPDTATRARQIAQVRALALPAPGEGEAPWHCGSAIDPWDALTRAPRPRLAARSEPQLATTGLCDIAASAGYRRLENQLYRVEIHSGGATPSFKWSRENGSVAYAVQEVRIDTATSRTVVRVAARGRDANLDLALHDRVELVDDDAELQGRAGQLFEYLNDGDDALELVLAGVPPGTLGQDAARHPVLRRWDHRPAVAGENALPIVEGVWTTLEDGVQVRFEAGGSYRAGDYWQIPARTVSADVEWPRDADGEPVAREAAGIVDGWCRLGLVEVDAGGLVSVTSDCRDIFPPLTQMTQLLYVGGDGQDTTPGGTLAEPLRVRVARGALPVAGARVRFTVEAGGGQVGSPAANSVVVACNAQGLAECAWRLGTVAAQRVRAQLLTSGGDPIAEQVVVFAAKAFTPATGGGGQRGCEITIGEGGDFPVLSTELLAKLLADRPALCICFLPGTHTLEGLQLASQRGMRLSLHGCGPTAVVTVTGPIVLGGFAALELRDLALRMGPEATLQLPANTDVRLANLQIAGRGERGGMWLRVEGAGDLRMAGCEIAAAEAASLLLQGISGLCELVGNRFGGDVALYGEPSDNGIGPVVDRLLGGGFQVDPGAGRGRFVFSQNQVPRLRIGKETMGLLMQGQVRDVFQTVLLHGNTFTGIQSMCAGLLVSVTGNSFTAAQGDYGAVVGGRAAASGNAATVFGDTTRLFFLVPKGDTFRGAANMVFTLPPSTS